MEGLWYGETRWKKEAVWWFYMKGYLLLKVEERSAGTALLPRSGSRLLKRASTRKTLSWEPRRGA